MIWGKFIPMAFYAALAQIKWELEKGKENGKGFTRFSGIDSYLI